VRVLDSLVKRGLVQYDHDRLRYEPGPGLMDRRNSFLAGYAEAQS
jgi:DNA-binding IclR family transcriptional regulator